MKKKMEIILHPVRMRIIQTFLTAERLTAQEINQKLSDVATPTLYRHLNMLQEHEIIEVVEEHQVRGTVERVYALPSQDVFTKADLEKATPEDHLNYFLTFLMSLSAQFNDYILSSHADPLADNLSYRQVQIHLSDEEFMEMFKKIREAVMPHLKNEPAMDRKVYTVSTIFFPNESHGREKK